MKSYLFLQNLNNLSYISLLQIIVYQQLKILDLLKFKASTTLAHALCLTYVFHDYLIYDDI